LSHTPDEKKGSGNSEPMPDIIFMCIEKKLLLEFCDLFPQTAENIKRRALERRKRFMKQKNTNSRSYNEKKKQQAKDTAGNHSHANSSEHSGGLKINQKDDEQDKLSDFCTDEEPENFESQKEDMKMYLNKLNKRIDTLVEGLKKTDNMMSKMVDQKSIIEQIKAKKNAGGSYGQGPDNKKQA